MSVTLPRSAGVVAPPTAGGAVTGDDAPARIGPNAVLQLAGVLARRIDADQCAAILARAGIESLPDGESMIDERVVARLHRVVRRSLPNQAESLMTAAGDATGRYILEHRIPAAVRTLLPRLPRPISRRLLARAIARHAWTFAGSGRFTVLASGRPALAIEDNPVVRGERSAEPLCHWHAAVFERLYRQLVDDRYRAAETTCCAAGDDACRFTLRRGRLPGASPRPCGSESRRG